MVNIEKIKKIHKEITQTHQDLIKTLDSAELEILPEKSSKIAIDISLFEDITNLASKLYDKDQILASHLKQAHSYKNIKYEIQSLRRQMINMRRLVLENTRHIQKDIKKISLILSEYKQRCRSSFIEFLKNLEVDLRKTLKPLVPSDVLQEQINFRPIASDPDLLSSMGSANNDLSGLPCENTVDRLNNHIQLLVNTLEDVAKSLINITQNTYRSYYELVDPNLLYSEPPSPLAAPLPEYFSYDIGNNSEENRKKGSISLTAKAKERLIQKFLAIQKSNGTKSPLTSRKIQEKLEKMLTGNVKETDLLEFFIEEGIPVSEREKLVYEVIHSERSGGRDVSLEDIIDVYDKRSNGKKDQKKEQNEYQKEHKDQKDRNIKDQKKQADKVPVTMYTEASEIDEEDEDLGLLSLETFIEEKEKLSRNHSKPNLMKNDIPPLQLKTEPSEKPRVSIENKDQMGRPRASTPGKGKKVMKNPKRIKTPVIVKKHNKHK
ncbi:hypothetical protein SteCoe_5065 [Stentor coeruleus]|uniref:Uncharacterized protein n=1 Tax=Stentor coeruleus TaxID=5963 RepID=A0A1R2CT90_9CILI|nr:hypothetical protein SteCoe_5065 [Stentor coeruleus]